MRWNDWLHLGLLVFFFGLFVYDSLAIARLKDQVFQLEINMDAIKLRRETFYKSLSDPNEIAAQMEQGAVAMEALQSKRRRRIRDDAGPHARVWKPKKVGRLQKTYRDYVTFDEAKRLDKNRKND